MNTYQNTLSERSRGVGWNCSTKTQQQVEFSSGPKRSSDKCILRNLLLDSWSQHNIITSRAHPRTQTERSQHDRNTENDVSPHSVGHIPSSIYLNKMEEPKPKINLQDGWFSKRRPGRGNHCRGDTRTGPKRTHNALSERSLCVTFRPGRSTFAQNAKPKHF